MQSFFKNDAANQLNGFIKDDNLELIRIHKNDINDNSSIINFTEEDEFLYGGMMYDVYKTAVKGDSIYYYCVSDENENNLEKAFASYLNTKTSNNTRSNAVNNILLNITKIGLTPVNSDIIFYQTGVYFAINKYYHPGNLSLETLTPPPRTI